MMGYSRSILMVLLFLLSHMLMAEEKNPNVFYPRSFSSKGDSLFYRVTYPKGYSDKGTATYPLVIVLHNEDSYAKGNEHLSPNLVPQSMVRLFLSPAFKDSFPAIVAFPQCRANDAWTEIGKSDTANVVPFPESPQKSNATKLVERMIKYYTKHYRVDKKRIYVVGLGAVGGSGALDLAVRNPKKFAAAVSICGAVNPERAKSLKKVPVRLYSSTSLTEVPITLVHDVYIEMKTVGAVDVDPVIELPASTDADCVVSAVNSKDFLYWMFSKKQK